MKKLSQGFTIVELLVVIVVIGILAAISVVSYVGISNRAVIASMQSDLKSSSDMLKIYAAQNNNSFPTSMSYSGSLFCPTPADTRYCLPASPGNTYSYSSSSSTTFILTVSHSGISDYQITQDSGPIAVSISVSGGTVTYVDSSGANPRSSPSYPGGYTIRTFTTVGNDSLNVSGGTITGASILVIAGGGGGAGNYCWGGGGGAGGYIYDTNVTLSGTMTVTVGGGGAGGSSQGTNGGNSVLGSYTAIGGGAGGCNMDGTVGGSGGGGGAWSNHGAAGTAGQGYSGGNPVASTCSGAGGGAGGSPVGCAGGIGKSSNISGSTVWYAGGGPGVGGSPGVTGCGMYGISYGSPAAVAPPNNTGCGGPGSDWPSDAATRHGASGIVVVKYPNQS